jgi:hypothetical protein
MNGTVTGQQDEEMVLVPRNPTKEMLEAGWYEAHDENAAGTWRDMIEAWELSQKQRELSQG